MRDDLFSKFYMNHAKFNSKHFAKVFANDLHETLNDKFPANWASTSNGAGTKWYCSVDLVLDGEQGALKVIPLDMPNYGVTLTLDSYSDLVEGSDPIQIILTAVSRLSHTVALLIEAGDDRDFYVRLNNFLLKLREELSIDDEDLEANPCAIFTEPDDPPVITVRKAHMTGIIKRIGQMVRNGNTIFLYTVEAKYGSEFRFVEGHLYYVAIDSMIDLVRNDPAPILALAEVGDLLQINFDGEIHGKVRIVPKKLSSYGMKSGPW